MATAAGTPSRRRRRTPSLCTGWTPCIPGTSRDKPGIAPDCGMKLVPVYAGEEARYERRATNCPRAPCRSRPKSSSSSAWNTAPRSTRPCADSIRAAARVTLDETNIAKVQSKLEGWIDQVFVDFTGKYVREGRPAAHHLQSRGAGHPAGVPAGAQCAATDAREPGARNDGQHRQPGGRGAEAPGAVGHRRSPDRRDRPPARPSRTSR